MPIRPVHIVEALSQLGGQAHLDQIVPKVIDLVPDHEAESPGSSVRARLQENCAASPHFKGDDLFESVYGLAARKGVWRLKSDLLSPADSDSTLDGAEAEIEAAEGRARLRIHLRRERSRSLIRQFKARLTSFACEACGDDMAMIYGDMGAGYIEAHHRTPVARMEEGATTRLADLAALCANCHRIIHLNQHLTVEALAAHLRARRSPYPVAAEPAAGRWTADEDQ